MWSKLLSEALDCEWTNLSQIGAGNEVIANLVLDQLAKTENTADTLWIVQWTRPERLDLQNPQRFADQIVNDPVYHRNFITTEQGQHYWCSSASELDLVKNYHLIIDSQQHQSRSRLAQLAVAHALEQRSVAWHYCLTYSAPWREQLLIPEHRWILPSLNEFRHHSYYCDLDVGYIQPVSSVHLDWIEQKILPGYEYDREKFEIIRTRTVDQDRQRKDLGPGTAV